MCEKCKELDQRIEHYRRLSQSITDQPTIDRFKGAIRDLLKVRPPRLAASFIGLAAAACT
jgi:hypothetical protein